MTEVHPHPDEPHDRPLGDRLNRLRAAVLGANDGIVSTAALVVGVAGATSNTGLLISAGAAGLIGGAVSMALGEYVSVSSQRDTETSLIAKEKAELSAEPDTELAELAGLYRQRGLSEETAAKVAEELTAHDALDAHLDAELHLDRTDLANPWAAAAASAASFTVGGLLPFAAIVLSSTQLRVPITFVAVLLALIGTGWLSATIAGAPRVRSVMRLVIGGALALTVTYLAGLWLGT